MNNKLLLIVGLVIAGAVGAFLFFKKPATDGTLMSGTGTGQAISANFKQLLAMGQDYHCTFDSADEQGMTTAGEVYVADQGKKLSGEFMTESTDDTTVQSNVIYDGEYSYIWSSSMTQGYKMKIDPEDESLFGGDQAESDQKTFDDSEPVNFNCETWRVDNNAFVPPSNIEFIDMSAQMEMMMQQMPQATGVQGDAPQANCAVCDQVPGEAKAQCLSAMGC